MIKKKLFYGVVLCIDKNILKELFILGGDK